MLQQPYPAMQSRNLLRIKFSISHVWIFYRQQTILIYNLHIHITNLSFSFRSNPKNIACLIEYGGLKVIKQQILQKGIAWSRHLRQNQLRSLRVSMTVATFTGICSSRRKCTISSGVYRKRRRIYERKWGIYGGCRKRKPTPLGKRLGIPLLKLGPCC